MTFGEKLSKIRKENNITQEQLADTLGVSRQSISKWESDLAFPETDKIVRISEIFHCSLDYLLKNGITEKEEPMASAPADTRRTVTMEEAERFLSIKKKNVLPTAIATFLCILSPICLMLLGAMSEQSNSGVSENMAGGSGMVILLIMVAVAVAMFIATGKHTEEFAFLEKEEIRVSADVLRFAREKKEAYRTAYTRGNAIGTLLCILSLVPLFLGVMLFEEDALMMTMMLCGMLVIIGIGVMFFICVGMPWASYNKLLQEDDYTPEKKAASGVISGITVVYWIMATAVFLCLGFLTDNWKYSGLVWPIAGVLYPAVLILCKLAVGKKK